MLRRVRPLRRAILVNFATFAVIGKCSAVTYQVIGHLKTMLAGCALSPPATPADGENIAGLLVALFGMILYARAEMRDRALTTASKSTADTECVRPLIPCDAIRVVPILVRLRLRKPYPPKPERARY